VLLKRPPSSLLKFKDLVLRRRTGNGSYVNMLWVPATTVPVTIKALYHSRISNTELVKLPETLRNKKLVRIFSGDEIRQKEEHLNQDADEFTYLGEDYQVFKVEPWDDVSGFSGYQAYAVKKDVEVL
jgi:hypothetical protein